jgi:hypothetical protein
MARNSGNRKAVQYVGLFDDQGTVLKYRGNCRSIREVGWLWSIARFIKTCRSCNKSELFLYLTNEPSEMSREEPTGNR